MGRGYQMTKKNTLDDISRKYAVDIAKASDNALFGFVKGTIELLQYQGKDITKYAIISVNNPMEYTKGNMRITSQFRVVPISELENAPIYGDYTKQQIAQAIEDAKPEKKQILDSSYLEINTYREGFNNAIEEYHQNLKRSLGL